MKRSIPKSESAPVAVMEAQLVDALPEGTGWQFEPKWDGFRCLAVRDGEAVELIGKSGKSLARYFPEVVAGLGQHPARRFVLDGELAVPMGSALSFDALQMRLHPAQSRILRLSKETPAILIVFDMLKTADGTDLVSAPLRKRRLALEAFFKTYGSDQLLHLSPVTTRLTEAKKWLARAGGGALDGVVAKRQDERYRAGERVMLKIKRLRTADCVVGGFRYASTRADGGARVVGSLLLGLFDAGGKLDHVGFTSAVAANERPGLTRKLEALRGGPGFTGRAPGGPSRWSTERSSEWEPVKPRLVAEVQYDHVTGDRFRHGTRFVRWRPDKEPHQCTMAQLRLEVRPSKLLKAIAS
ncbi:ATP-dependent DNA ligase [Enhydrobacter aerosaccus]|uniref:DNA ligase (ATP) n=1 Tax=Enhydrobacter aerosaccus TaxID=225324 RepID=A0A1T4RXA1_9HYPH|nr:ATP-dependent DNA ligase [Enhydrobacter aerosaccus]SKA20368.1 ATP-dependent DNA ligase [Enhydrobacter aerosaccus]